jgi:hypothetical protein
MAPRSGLRHGGLRRPGDVPVLAVTGTSTAVFISLRVTR